MISKALQFLHGMLDQFLRNRFSSDHSTVVLNNLIESNGNIPQLNQNKVIISLINIEKETTKPFYIRNQKLSDGNYADVNPNVRFNLDLLISVNFDDYAENLKFLDAVLLFFQAHPVLDANTSASIPYGLNKLEFEIEKITFHNMQSLWTAMGAKYQPSVIYKMRLITIQAGEVDGVTPAVIQTANTVAA